MSRHLNGVLLSALLIVAAGSVSAHPGDHPQAGARPAAQAPPEAARVVDAFHSALSRGDNVTALAQLADDVLIFEAAVGPSGLRPSTLRPTWPATPPSPRPSPPSSCAAPEASATRSPGSPRRVGHRAATRTVT